MKSKSQRTGAKRQKRTKKAGGKQRYHADRPAVRGPLGWVQDVEKMMDKEPGGRHG